MSFWRAETLSAKLPSLIDPFDPKAIDCAAYTLHVGDEVYISPDQKIKNPNRHTKQKLANGECFAIPPGQFAFLVTKENVKVPDNALAFLSIKARIKFSGLINISGFHVDPGYSGKLLFSVLNAGPKPLHLQQGQELFLIWYTNLDGSTKHKKHKDRGFNQIEPELINRISGEILSLQSLSDKQHVLEKELAQQKTRVNIFILLVITLIVVPVSGWLWPKIQALF